MNLKKILGIILVVVAAVMVGFGIYVMNSSKYIFKTALSGVFNYAVDGYIELTEELKDTEEFDKFKISTENSLKMAGIEFATINGEIYTDIEKNGFYINLDSALAGEKFLGGEVLLKDNVMYAKLKEAMDSFYFTEMEEDIFKEAFIKGEEIKEIDYSNILELTKEEVERLANHLEKSILKDVPNKDIKKSSETIKVDNKDTKTTKVSLKISDKRQNEIIINFLEEISNDSDSIKILQKIDKSITKQSIEEIVDSLKKKTTLSTVSGIELSFYIKGFNNLVRTEIAAYSNDNANVNMHMFVDVYKNKNKNEVTSLEYHLDEEVYSFEIEQINDSKSKIIAKQDGVVVITGEVNETNKASEILLEMPAQNISIKIKETTVKENEKYIIEFNFIEKTSMTSFDSTNTLTIGEEIPEVNVDGAISFEEMTDEDYEKISKYFEEKLSSLGLFDTSYDDNCLDSNCIGYDDEYDLYEE